MHLMLRKFFPRNCPLHNFAFFLILKQNYFILLSTTKLHAVLPIKLDYKCNSTKHILHALFHTSKKLTFDNSKNKFPSKSKTERIKLVLCDKKLGNEK